MQYSRSTMSGEPTPPADAVIPINGRPRRTGTALAVKSKEPHAGLEPSEKKVKTEAIRIKQAIVGLVLAMYENQGSVMSERSSAETSSLRDIANEGLSIAQSFPGGDIIATLPGLRNPFLEQDVLDALVNRGEGSLKRIKEYIERNEPVSLVIREIVSTDQAKGIIDYKQHEIVAWGNSDEVGVSESDIQTAMMNLKVLRPIQDGDYTSGVVPMPIPVIRQDTTYRIGVKADDLRKRVQKIVTRKTPTMYANASTQNQEVYESQKTETLKDVTRNNLLPEGVAKADEILALIRRKLKPSTVSASSTVRESVSELPQLRPKNV